MEYSEIERKMAEILNGYRKEGRSRIRGVFPSIRSWIRKTAQGRKNRAAPEKEQTVMISTWAVNTPSFSRR